jgi:hypothetical protein
MKIAMNGAGFVIMYISYGTYIPGILVGASLMLSSIAIVHEK